jgi:hypothetical protein
MSVNKIIFLLPIIIFLACKAQQSGNEASNSQLNRKIVNKIGYEFNSANNFDDSMVLSWTESDSNGTLLLKYGVWIIETGELLYYDTAIGGKVEWLDNNSLIVTETPGITDEDNQHYKYKIDLNTKIKIPLDAKEDL